MVAPLHLEAVTCQGEQMLIASGVDPELVYSLPYVTLPNPDA